ncbi:hypothetical protein JKP88DRAFT_265446 [Tribonema minus]|uniref:DUF4168 domain-containing protein n=1 Tax=Tribonema minus TaxID=303371 RepID=A0A835YJ45_9STRA|nr:hypothetical protein JKP88DRAFT_265446 [Tribonema minus]
MRVVSVIVVLCWCSHVVLVSAAGANSHRSDSSSKGISGVTTQMVSLFSPEEYELDRYAAAMAATEWLRRERDAIIRENTNALAYWYLKATKGDQYTKWMSSPLVTDKSRKAQHNFLMLAGRIITSCDLSISRFNQLTKLVAQDKQLASRVNRQAYLYRVGAELHGDKFLPVEDLREAAKGGRSGRGNGEFSDGANGLSAMALLGQPKKLRLFAKSLREVESLRMEQRRRLMETLEVDELPQGLCMTRMARVSSPIVRRACEQFPLQAAAVVRANGLRTEEFNRLLQRAQKNLVYRYRVLRLVHKLGEQEEGDF